MTSPLELKNSDLMIGLEIHQQLATNTKLFCECTKFEEDNYDSEFLRSLRPTQSELGYVDPAALFEFKKGTKIKYLFGDESSCMVEMDEEPPHNLNMDAVESAILISLALGAKIVDEIHVMRKIVIDGSNTSGFQRTAVIAMGGELKVGSSSVEVQSISVEEDAARLIGESEGVRKYGLDRLGVPLVEVALAPFRNYSEAQNIALALGRLMRMTGKVARGIGSIRQDINISLAGGEVVEVKGVQQLDLISKIIDYELVRQKGLIALAMELKKRGIVFNNAADLPVDLTNLFRSTKNPLISSIISKNGVVYGVKMNGFKNLLKLEPYPGVRLGLEMAGIVKFYGLGGILHSDELPAHGISKHDVDLVSNRLHMNEQDAFSIIAGEKKKVIDASKALVDRTKAAVLGVQAETRGPTQDGKTKYIRPRPGPSRMYPETDILPLSIGENILSRISKSIPSSWEDMVNDYVDKYKLHKTLVMKLIDSEQLNIFEEVVSSTKIQPTFIAATLTETLVSLNRKGLNLSKLDNSNLRKLFINIDKNTVSKELTGSILEDFISTDDLSIEDTIKRLGTNILSDVELKSMISDIVSSNLSIITEKGDRSFSILMGLVMQQARGRADGQKISDFLKKKLSDQIL